MKAIIVEDEKLAQENLIQKLEENCPAVEIIDVCNSGASAVKSIHQKEPDLVFMDIKLGDMNGFGVLERLRHIKFELIFITAEPKYMRKAFKEDAIDYLVKPFLPEELVDAVQRANLKLERSRNSNPVRRIKVPNSHGYRYLNTDDIVRCQANNNRCKIFLWSREIVDTSRCLGEIEKLLSENNFLRIHRGHLINKLFLREHSREDGGYVILNDHDETRLPVTNRDLFR
jgi:two-component system, LytTR family, response regulator